MYLYKKKTSKKKKKRNYINCQLGLWWRGIKRIIPNHLATTKIRGLPIAGAGVLFQHPPDKIQNGVLLLDISLKRVVMMKGCFTVIVWGSEYLNLKERYIHVQIHRQYKCHWQIQTGGLRGLQPNPCWIKELSFLKTSGITKVKARKTCTCLRLLDVKKIINILLGMGRRG